LNGSNKISPDPKESEMTARSYGPQGPLDPAARALADALSSNPTWQAMAKTPIEQTRREFAALTAFLPPAEPVLRVQDFAIPVEGGEILARLYVATNTPRSLVVWFHGGGFVLGSVAQSDNFARHFANCAGGAVLSVDYRLAPEHPFPTAVNDSVAAARWAMHNLSHLGLPHLPIFIGGDSAGANLATVAARELRDAKVPGLVGQILAYPCTDHAEAASLHRFAPPFLTKSELEWLFSQYVTDAAQRRDPRFAPIYTDDLSNLPPAILITAEHDLLTEQAEEYGLRMASAGVDVEINRHAGQFHGFFTMDAFFNGEGDRAMAKVLDFMERARDR
jgi:acetyl esterase